MQLSHYFHILILIYARLRLFKYIKIDTCIFHFTADLFINVLSPCKMIKMQCIRAITTVLRNCSSFSDLGMILSNSNAVVAFHLLVVWH